MHSTKLIVDEVDKEGVSPCGFIVFDHASNRGSASCNDHKFFGSGDRSIKQIA